MDTLIDLPEPETPEEAVIAHYRLSDDQYGSCVEREAMEPTLRGVPFRPAYVVLRQGSRETETRVDL